MPQWPMAGSDYGSWLAESNATRIFLRTRGVLLPLLVHLMMNHAFKSLCLSPSVAVIIGVVSASAVLLAGGLRARFLDESSNREDQSPSLS